MIKNFIGLKSARLAVMQVIDRYITESTPEIDLIDFNGIVYTGCTVISLGGGDLDRMSAPALNAEVLTVQQGPGAPYVIGVLSEGQSYVDEITLDSAGEYPANQISIDHNELKSAGARIIAGESALYLSPRARVQGVLEVSSGATPAQHIAVAEPTIETLETYQARLDELRTAVLSLQTALTSIVGALKLDIPLGVTAALEVVSLPADRVETIAAPSDRIASQIAKIER
jgi:hypothetical protein